MPPIVVLCGGAGTRLRPVVDSRPKVLAPIGGEPFLAHLLRELETSGTEHIYLSTGYMGEQIANFVQNHDWKVPVECVQEPEPLGTGGALRYVCSQTAISGPFLAMNGDTYFDARLADLYTFFREKNSPAGALALARVDSGDRFGQVILEEDTDRILTFKEKQDTPPGPVWISAGVYLLQPRVVTNLPPNEKISIEKDVFPRWTGKNGELFGLRFPEATFFDFGTPEDYQRLNQWITNQ